MSMRRRLSGPPLPQAWRRRFSLHPPPRATAVLIYLYICVICATSVALRLNPAAAFLRQTYSHYTRTGGPDPSSLSSAEVARLLRGGGVGNEPSDTGDNRTEEVEEIGLEDGESAPPSPAEPKEGDADSSSGENGPTEEGISNVFDVDGDEKEGISEDILPSNSDVGDDDCMASREMEKSSRKDSETLRLQTVLMDSLSGSEAGEELMDLRRKIQERLEDYINDLPLDPADGDPQHPMKVLRHIAPKIPAIQRSPNFTLRISSANADIDAAAAAYAIFCLGGITELYERRFVPPRDLGASEEARAKGKKAPVTVSQELISDRRFEQLVECVLCGLDMKRAIVVESGAMSKTQQGSSDGAWDDADNGGDIKEGGLPDSENYGEDIGKDESLNCGRLDQGKNRGKKNKDEITARDAAMAAWGMAVLGVHRNSICEELGGHSPGDIIQMLCHRSRDAILLRLDDLCRRDDELQYDSDDKGEKEDRSVLFNRGMAALAKDAAFSLWAFACVRACVGAEGGSLYWDQHIDACCLILAKDKERLWKVLKSGSNEEQIVDRLALSEVKDQGVLEREYVNINSVLKEEESLIKEEEVDVDVNDAHAIESHNCDTLISSTDSIDSVLKDGHLLEEEDREADGDEEVTLHACDNDSSPELLQDNGIGSKVRNMHDSSDVSFLDMIRRNDSSKEDREPSLLLNRLSPHEVTNVLWALASPGIGKDAHLAPKVRLLSPQKESVVEALVRRLSFLLQHDLEELQRIKSMDVCRDQRVKADERHGIVAVDETSETGENHPHINSTDSKGAGEAYHLVSTKGATPTSGAHGETKDRDPAIPNVLLESYNRSETARSVLENDLEGREGEDAMMGTDCSSLEVETLTTGHETIDVIDASALLAHEGQINTENSHAGTEVLVENNRETNEGTNSLTNLRTLELRDEENNISEGGKDTKNGDVGSDLAQVINDGDKREANRTSEHPTKNEVFGDPTFEENLSGARYSMHGDQMLSKVDTFLSLRDLCSASWALTELEVSSCVNIIGQVAMVTLSLGKDDMKELQAGDLSNLAWSIARSMEFADTLTSEVFISVTQWIGECGVLCLDKRGSLFGQSVSKMDGQGCSSAIEASHLSRLMLSLASVASFYHDSFPIDISLSDLAQFAITYAASNLSAFSPEDLARIAWALTEICDKFTVQKSAIESMGRILATVKASLLRWESGHYSGERKIEDKTCDSVRFTPLFGRSRTSIPYLDHKFTYNDEEDESTSRSFLKQQRVLPTLRTLPVDPQTICKLASGLSKLAIKYPYMSETSFIRIAARLFASKQGRLLKECNNHDIVRLCCACANMMKAPRNELSSTDQDFVFGYFPRKILQHINNSTRGDESFLDQLEVHSLADVVWSLGELGVQASEERNQHKKLRLTTKIPNLSGDQLSSLSPSSLSKLFCGLIAIGDLPNNYDLLISVLREVKLKVPLLQTGDLCQSAVCLQKLWRAVTPDSLSMTFDNKASSLDETTSKCKGEMIQEEAIPSSEAGDVIESSFEVQKAEAESVIDSLSSDNNIGFMLHDIRSHSNALLQLIAEEVSNTVSHFLVQDLQIILEVFTLLPHRHDSLIDTIHTEIKKRLKTLDAADAMPDVGSVEKIVRRAADAAVDAATALSSWSSDVGGSLNILKKGLKALSSIVNDDSVRDKEEAADELSIIATHMHSAAASMCDAATRIERVDKGAMTSVEELLRRAEDAAAFELGRCQELVVGYRQFGFETVHRSDSDIERWTENEKYILSRLFQ